MAKLKNIKRILDAEHIISEGNGRQSREQAKLAFRGTDLVVQPGTVLGRISDADAGALNGALCVYKAGDAKITGPVGINYARVEGAVSTQKAVTYTARDAEVNGHKLTWDAAMSTPNKTTAIAALAALGILVRF